MTKIMVGQKGQVTLIKGLREKYGIAPGTVVEEVETDEGILIRPVANPFERWTKLKRTISERWPDISAVQAIREDRGDKDK
jgi:bifunctional DNA-binding transcriptional regulator/antitoxin component of YhaV-PrlF toxin-antitoxin module